MTQLLLVDVDSIWRQRINVGKMKEYVFQKLKNIIGKEEHASSSTMFTNEYLFEKHELYHQG